jgi:hypothetical protein
MNAWILPSGKYYDASNNVAAGSRLATQAEIDAHDAEKLAAIALQAQDEVAKNVAIVNPVIQYLVSHTPAECIAKSE